MSIELTVLVLAATTTHSNRFALDSSLGLLAVDGGATHERTHEHQTVIVMAPATARKRPPEPVETTEVIAEGQDLVQVCPSQAC